MTTISYKAVGISSGSDTISTDTGDISIGDGDLIFVGTVADATLTAPAQAMSVQNVPASNTAWARTVRLTTEAVICMKNGVGRACLTVDALVRMIVSVLPGLSWPPKIVTQPTDTTCPNHTGGTAVFTVGLGASEFSATSTYLWQCEDATTYATGTLTSNNTNVTAGDTVTIGSKVYTFVDALSVPAIEGEVLKSSTADLSLANLVLAINHGSTMGTNYSCVAANPDVAAASVGSHASVMTAKVAGTASNSVATTDTAATLSWGTATLINGGYATATSSINDCAYSGETTYALTCTPSTMQQSGVGHRCVITNVAGRTESNVAILAIL